MSGALRAPVVQPAVPGARGRADALEPAAPGGQRAQGRESRTNTCVSSWATVTPVGGLASDGQNQQEPCGHESGNYRDHAEAGGSGRAADRRPNRLSHLFPEAFHLFTSSRGGRLVTLPPLCYERMTWVSGRWSNRVVPA